MNRPVLTLLFTFALTLGANAQRYVAQDGHPRAEIVIAETPLRSVRLAAHELQETLEKISGARLPIVTAPNGESVHLFVGRSRYTDDRHLSADGLHDGAFRLVSGGDWLAFLGEDTEFTPIEPWGKNNGDLTSGRSQREWESIIGAPYGLPNLLIYKDRFSMPGEIGLPDAERPHGAKLPPLELWSFDERGSYNAVCAFLQKLGVRWYAPGELGEVLPQLPTIPLPQLDETVRPDFSMRRVNIRPAVHGANLARWAMRLGVRDPYGIQSAHGLDQMANREEVFAAHPDWFAMYGGQRRFQPHQNNHLCYSNEELFRETVRYVRAQFDHYHLDAVSVMPPDGYTAICQCPLCAGKDAPARGSRGFASDYIWSFVNRVAREVRTTHPGKKVLNCAYGIYSLPPEKIERLEPNVLVSIVGGRRPVNNRPEDQEECRQLREAWRAKTANPLIIFENYPFTDRGWYLPSFTPHSLGATANAIKGQVSGEDIWLSIRQDFEQTGMGLNHFLIYFTQRTYWGGREADVDSLFREYCRLFYGPAEREMLEFFTYCEANWQAMEKEKEKADTALALFSKAQAKPPTDSIFAKRLAVMDEYLQGLRHKAVQLGRIRGPVPVLRLVGETRGDIKIDGLLDDAPWRDCPVAATARLRELQTGRAPIFGTSVKTAWRGANLYVAIRCEDHLGDKPNIGATRHDDSALWYGDAVEVLLETESHSYYQIAVSPSGAVADLDRSAKHDAWFSWDAQAEVATHLEDGAWTVEMRLPITADENDPLHQVVGRHPTKSLPWHINICRQRIRDDGAEYSALSPTGAADFHHPLKFATFFDGNSFDFPHGPPDDDVLDVLRRGSELVRSGQREEALAIYEKAADQPCTDVQKSHLLEVAAALRRGRGDYDGAARLAHVIPIEAVKKCVIMEGLLQQQKSTAVVDRFGNEDIAAWPFWKRGEGFHLRGKAFHNLRKATSAEADLLRALEWTSDPRLRDNIELNLAQNRGDNFNDPDAALTWYAKILATDKPLGAADQFYAVIGTARIHLDRQRYDDALAIIARAKSENLQGVWRGNLLLSRAEVLAEAGRKPEAQALYRALSNDATIEPSQRRQATARIEK